MGLRDVPIERNKRPTSAALYTEKIYAENPSSLHEKVSNAFKGFKSSNNNSKSATVWADDVIYYPSVKSCNKSPSREMIQCKQTTYKIIIFCQLINSWQKTL